LWHLYGRSDRIRNTESLRVHILSRLYSRVAERGHYCDQDIRAAEALPPMQDRVLLCHAIQDAYSGSEERTGIRCIHPIAEAHHLSGKPGNPYFTIPGLICLKIECA
jgi:hypothetical protein